MPLPVVDLVTHWQVEQALGIEGLLGLGHNVAVGQQVVHAWYRRRAGVAEPRDLPGGGALGQDPWPRIGGEALQVQQQLGIQALSIANSGSQSILSLFRG